MKNYIFLALIVFSISCTPVNYTFKTIECTPDETPEFDGKVVSMLKDGVPYKDTIFEKIKKSRTVFKPCRKLIYRAIFKTDKGEIITDNYLSMMATGKRWKFQPSMQDEIVIQYLYSQEEIEKNTSQKMNKGINHPWQDEVIEGVIENEREVWMHPFRFNQYNFTEVAPFPEVQLPLEIGKTWTNQLSIGNGWGDWSDSYGNMEYRIVKKEDLKLPFNLVKDCWKVESSAIYSFGNSYLDFWFNENLGFIKMNYKNYGNQTLVFELVEVIES